MAPDVEQAILDHCLGHPSHGSLRVAQELLLKGGRCPTAARGALCRHGLQTKQERLLRLDKVTAERKIEHFHEQIRLL